MLAFRRAVVLVVVGLITATTPAIAQNVVADVGLYVSVPNPLTSDGVTRIKNRVTAARNRSDRRPATIVFDFNPGDKDANTPDFGPCYDLGDFIRSLTDTTTVAYVHKKTTGHTVLPLLTCKHIVMTPAGAVGEVVGPTEPALGGFKANGYTELVGQARPAFLAVARKTFDPAVQLRKAKKAGGDWFVDLRDQPSFAKDKIDLTDLAALPQAPDGRVRLFTAADLKELGLNRLIVASRAELFEAYGLSAASMKDDPLAGRVPNGFKHTIRGPIDLGLKEATARVVREVVRQKGNILVLQIECSGGDLQAARDLAEELRKAQDGDDGLLIIAFIPDRAPDTAAIVALGCSEIVMSKRKDVTAGGDDPAAEVEFGDFDHAVNKVLAGNPQFWIDSLRDLADQQGYPPILIEGMLRKELEIVRVHKKENRSVRRLMTGAEFAEDKAKGPAAEWVFDGQIKPKGQLLKLNATKAEELGLAKFTTDSRDIADVFPKYGLDPAKVKDTRPALVDRFADFLKIPAVTVLLVVIGFTGLILELKVPGTAVPGIIAALCFILVFWAHTQFSGQVAVLAGLLFLLGLILILLEVFVFPGFGAPGISGIVFMLGALALVTIERGPEGEIGYIAFGMKMAQYLFGIIGAAILAFIIARFLPNIPYANRMMLIPPSEKVGAETDPPVLPGAALAASLLGAVGTSVTVLRPAGSVQFGDQFIDVVSDGGFVPAGSRVQVIEVEGTRIVVKEV